MKRTAFGFRRFEHYRIRALLYAGRPNWSLLDQLTHREIRRAMNVLYLTAVHCQKNCENMSGRINDWEQILNAVTIHCGGHVEAVSQCPSRPATQPI